MDPNPAQLWIVGKFVPFAGVTDCAVDIVATSKSIGGTPQPAYPAHSKGIAADVFTAITGRERCHRRDGADDHSSDPGRGTRPAGTGFQGRAGLQKECRRDRESTDRDLAGGTSLNPETIDGDVSLL